MVLHYIEVLLLLLMLNHQCYAVVLDRTKNMISTRTLHLLIFLLALLLPLRPLLRLLRHQRFHLDLLLLTLCV